MLYQASYKRQGTQRRVTFHAWDSIEALDFVELWERMAKVKVDECKAIGTAKYTKTGKLRKDQL